MNNQWLSDLRRKMKNHTDDVPDDLWDKIRDELFYEEEKGSMIGLSVETSHSQGKEEKRSGRKIKPWIYCIARIAAAVALLLMVGKKLRNVNHKNIIKKLCYIEKADQIKIESQRSGAEVGLMNDGQSISFKGNYERSGKTVEQEPVGLSGHITKNFNAETWKTNPHVIPVEEIKLKALATLLLRNVGISQDQISHIKEGVRINNHKNEINGLMAEIHNDLENKSIISVIKERKSKAKKSWMVSMLAGKTSSDSHQFSGYGTMNCQPMNRDDVWAASGYEQGSFAGILLANQSQNVEATIRHKVPLNLGISLYYNIGKRWGIGTGINYTKLSSELHSGSLSNFVKSEKTIHYVGIPIQVNYNVIQKVFFTGYVTGGALVEKSVAGNVTTKYVVNSVVNEETKEDLSSQLVQVSLNTALGVQLKLIDKIGVYAEPGIGYYFKDNSSLNTIYKEKPLNFNVKFGVRIVLD